MTPRAKKPAPPKRAVSGFYELPDGTELLSVTNILKFGIVKDLDGWHGWKAGELAVESIPKLVRLRGVSERRKAAYWLGKEGDRFMKAAGKLGGEVHDLIEADILGLTVAAPSEKAQPFMDAYANFKAIERPEYEATELVVANIEDGWAGQLDTLLRLPNIAGQALLLGDWKSGSGAYPDYALQLSAYRRATVAWTKDGQETEVPKTEAAVVIHIRPDKYPDTGYRIYPFDTSDAVYAAFLKARRTAVDWAKGLSNTVVGEPYEPIQMAEVIEEVAS